LSKHSYTYKKLNRSLGKALHQYGMIHDGERIAVGISGGKDSLTLLWLLSERRARIPINYDIVAIYVDPGFEGGFTESLRSYCRSLNIDLVVNYSDCGIVAHSPKNRENPCFLCSRLRRRQLFESAEKQKCRKLALGHNKDDIIETLFLNICYGGEISTMCPYQTFFNGFFTVIRPLAFCDETAILKFAAEQGFPVFENPCPSAKLSKRKEIKTLLQQLYRSNKKIKGNIFRSMYNVRKDYLL
jgi:tRNA 2-thiocytidine biosynthesis protein TtcA